MLGYNCVPVVNNLSMQVAESYKLKHASSSSNNKSSDASVELHAYIHTTALTTAMHSLISIEPALTTTYASNGSAHLSTIILM